VFPRGGSIETARFQGAEPDVDYKQIAVAVGQGVIAALSAYEYLQK